MPRTTPLPLLLLIVSLGAHGAGVYRWTDTDGGIHYSDHPNRGAALLHTQSYPRSPLLAVSYVPDGDTIYLSNGEKVRIIGVNAPEVAHGTQPAEAWGPQAQRYLRQRLTGTRVRVEPGRERRDRYGRLLAYVYLEDGRDLGEELLKRGMAYVLPRPPNLRAIGHYLSVEADARFRRSGLWQLARYGIEPATRAQDFIHTFRRLRGRVHTVRSHGGRMELTLEGNLLVSYPTTDRQALKDASLDGGISAGRTIVVRGWLRSHNGRPYLRLHDPREIESLSAP